MANGDAPGGGKAAGAFRTIGELSRDTGLPAHILRYWETRFPQLRPVQRAGNRRYYRPDDVALVRRIDALLNREGYTIRGVQQLLANEAGPPAARPVGDALVAIRDLLVRALADDAG
jgi:DNA-binding transcriptional MerR regulator